MTRNKTIWLGVLGVFAATGLGALAALQIDHWMTSRREGAGVESAFNFRTHDAVSSASLEQLPTPIDFKAAAKRIMPAVVSIDTIGVRENWFGERFEAPLSEGSGVVISKDGYIVTNNHVVNRASQVTVHFSDGKSRTAKIIGTDPRSDLAVLKVDAQNLVPAIIGKSNVLQIGEWVMAVGNPLGYDNTVSVGVISSLGRTLATEESILAEAIQTDAAINQGNSGGALANSQGELIGINTAIASNSGGNIGIGFAIPIDQVQSVVQDIIRHGHARYGWLGLESYRQPGFLQNNRVRAQLKQEIGIDPPTQGLLVGRVSRNGPAAKAGLKVFDVITSIEGKKVVDYIDFQKVMMRKRPGDTIKLGIWSRGKENEVNITLADADRQFQQE